MDNVTVHDADILHRCTTTVNICGDMTWEMLCTAMSAVSVVVNILHLVAVHSMPSLKGRTYLKLLTHIGLVDIFSSISVILQINCQLHHLSYLRPKSIAAVISISSSVAPTVRYLIFVLASCDRYLAICKPMYYSQSKVVLYFHMWAAAGWVLCLSAVTVRDTVFLSHLCLNSMLGASNYVGVAPTSLTFTILIISFSISTVLQISVGLEIYRMNKRSHSKNDDVMKAALYILIIYIEFLCCLCPVLVCVVLNFNNRCRFHLAWFTTFVFALYGIVNTLTYGWLNPPYRVQVLTMLRCCRPNRVTPYGDNTKSKHTETAF